MVFIYNEFERFTTSKLSYRGDATVLNQIEKKMKTISSYAQPYECGMLNSNGNHFYHIKVSNGVRLILFLYNIENDFVLMPIEVMDHKLYDEFCLNPTKFATKRYQQFIEWFDNSNPPNEIKNFFNQEYQRTVQRPKKPNLPYSYQKWLRRTNLLENREFLETDVIYFSKFFITSLHKTKVMIEFITLTILRIINDDNKNDNDQLFTHPLFRWIQMYYDAEHNVGIIYIKNNRDYYILGYSHKSNDFTSINEFLNEQIEVNNNIKMLRNLFDNEDWPTAMEVLKRESQIVVPTFLSKSEFIEVLTGGNKPNLVFSKEEWDIIKEIESNEHTDQVTITFINGRAGSGKSTILQYLFAYYLRCKIKDQQNELAGKVIYLTYNRRLLETAKENICKIFQHNPFFSDVKVENFSTYFSTFKEFVGEPEEGHHINFSVFKDLYYHTDYSRKYSSNCYFNGRKRLSAEFCWYLIRAYLKGRINVPKNFDEFYNFVNNRETIDRETIKWLYDDVWNHWYARFSPLHYENDRIINQKTNLCFYDDLDLIKLNPVIGDENDWYSVIFCDEAQDLTELEYDYLLKRSIYYYYSLDEMTVDVLPFAFAGDPLQTLNPTGFNWDHIRASLYSYIKSTLNKEPNTPLLHLIYNYRSKMNLVRFSNFVLLIRDYINESSSESRSQKQIPYSVEQGYVPTVYIIISSTNSQLSKGEISEKDLIENFQSELIVLLPCDEGGINKFISEDNILNKISEEYKNNFFDTTSIKGMEFPKVILYKFGDYYLKEGLSDWRQIRREDKIKYSFFFNKLYVACTRAQDELVIVDSIEGFQNFWEKYFSSEFIEEFIENDKIQNPADYKSDVYYYIDNENNYIIANNIEAIKDKEENIRESAKAFMLYGTNKQQFLKAAHSFQRLSKQPNNPYKLEDEKNSKICFAKAYELEEQYESAGDLYREINELTEAKEAYWKWFLLKNDESDRCRVLDKLLELKLKGTEQLLAQYFRNRSVNEGIELLNVIQKKDLRDKLWNNFLKMVSEDIQNSDNDELKESFINAYQRIEYENKAFRDNNSFIVRAYLQLLKQKKRFNSIVEYFENRKELINSEHRQFYHESKLEITTDDFVKLEHLSALRPRTNDEILRIWKIHCEEMKYLTSPRWIKEVANIYQNSGQFEKAFSTYYSAIEQELQDEELLNAIQQDFTELFNHLEARFSKDNSYVNELTGLRIKYYDYVANVPTVLITAKLRDLYLQDKVFLPSFLKALSRCDEYTVHLKKEEFEFYRSIVDNYLKSTNWREVISSQDVILLFRRLQTSILALQFFEYVIENDSSLTEEERNSFIEEWKFYKNEQIQYFQKIGDKEKETNETKRLKYYLSKWQDYDYPSLPDKTTEEKKLKNLVRDLKQKRDYLKIVNLLEENDLTMYYEYAEAKAEISNDLNEKARWYRKAGKEIELKKLSEQMLKDPSTYTDGIIQYAVLLNQRKKHKEALDLYLKIQNVDGLIYTLKYFSNDTENKAKYIDIISNIPYYLKYGNNATKLIYKWYNLLKSYSLEQERIDLLLIRFLSSYSDAFRLEHDIRKIIKETVLRIINQMDKNKFSFSLMTQIAQTIEVFLPYNASEIYFSFLNNYNSVMDSNQILWLKKRWIVSKKRKITLFKSRKEARSIINEEEVQLKERIKMWNISSDVLMNYPMDDIKRFNLQNLVKHNKVAHEIVMEFPETTVTVQYNKIKPNVSSSDTPVIPKHTINEYVYVVEPMNLRIAISKNKNYIELAIDEENVMRINLST